MLGRAKELEPDSHDVRALLGRRLDEGRFNNVLIVKLVGFLLIVGGLRKCLKVVADRLFAHRLLDRTEQTLLALLEELVEAGGPQQRRIHPMTRDHLVELIARKSAARLKSLDVLGG